MNGFEIHINGNRVTNVGMVEEGNFAILVTVNVKDGLILGGIDIHASGFVPETQEYRKWANLQLDWPVEIMLKPNLEMAEAQSCFQVYDPKPTSADE